MKNIKVKIENEHMSIWVEGIQLKMHDKGYFIISKEIMTGVNITDLPNDVVFGVNTHLNGGSDDLPNILYLLREKDNMVHLQYDDYIITEDWKNDVSTLLFLQSRLGVLLKTLEIALFSFHYFDAGAILSFHTHVVGNTVDEVIDKAEHIIESIETNHKNILDKIGLYLAVECAK